MLKKICGFLSGILLLILAVLAVLLLGPRIMGYQSMAVLTGSMEPAYPVGSLIYVKEVEPETLETGDVITYQLSGDTVVTHRIVEIHKDTQEVVTKGDANETNDGNPIPYEAIVGKADFNIPYLGYIAIYAKTPIGIGVVCGVLVAIILLTFIPEIFSEDEEEEKTKKKADEIKTKKN